MVYIYILAHATTVWHRELFYTVTLL